MKKALFVVLMFVSCVAIAPSPAHHLPDTGFAAAGGAPDVTSPCARACAALARMGCAEAQPTTNGAPCAAVCENAEQSGVVSFNPECVASAESCSIAAHCGDS